MTHVGQELALGTSSRFRGFFGHSQVFFRLFARSDIPEHALRSDDCACIVEHRHLDDVHPSSLTIRVDSGFFRFKGLPRLHQEFVDLPIFLRQLGWIDLEIGFTDNFV